MNKYKLCTSFILIVLVVFASCSQKVVAPALSKKQEVNTAAFNYAYGEGMKQKLMGNLAEALSNFEQCIVIDPLSDAAYYEIAEITVSSGNLKAGKDYVLKAVNINERNFWYLSLLADIYYEDKNLDSCIIYYEKAINYFPEKEDIKLELAGIYAENREFGKAIDIYKSFDDNLGVNENTTPLRVSCLMLEGNFEEAEVIALSLIEKFPDVVLYSGLLAEIYSSKGDNEKALESYSILLEKNPDDAQVQLSLMDFLLKEQYYDDLTGFVNTVIININVSKEDKVTLMLSFFEDSTLLADYSENLNLSLMLLESEYADDQTVMLLRPELYGKEGRLPEAISKLEAYVKKFPDYYYGWEKLLLDYSEIRDYEKLYTRGKEFATKFNMSILAKLLYASGATESKDYKAALDELKKATILANDDKAVMYQILSMEADNYYRMGDLTLAFAKYDELLKNSPDDIMVLNNYAYFLAEQNQNLKVAEQMSERTILVEKDNATYLDTYAWILYKRGKLKEAAQIMEDIINVKKAVGAEYLEHYGFILKGLNKCDEASIYWNKAIDLDNSKLKLKEEISDCQAKR